jgi:hypothetical protein
MQVLSQSALSRAIYALSIIYCSYAVANDSGPRALLGGQGNAPYAAFLQTDGSIKQLPGLPSAGLTFRVAINPSGYGIIGGTSGAGPNPAAYAALVSPDGILNPIGGLPAPAEIYSVAINSLGNGIVGGGRFTTNVPYAALVSKTGGATSLALPANGLIYSVAIDSSGEGMVGGIGLANSAYASIVSPAGVVTPLAGLPTTGAIFWVAVNDSKTRFIGGQDNSSLYAAFVAPDGSVEPVPGLPSGTVYSVALNPQGDAIMGGTSSGLPYAALVARDRSVRTLSGLPTTPGIIYNVAINDSGTGLMTGFAASGPYGSLVAPDGALTPLRGLPIGSGPADFLDGAALHSSGVGIVGGTFSNAPLAALVAPDGTLTYLSGLLGNGQINSISIATLDNLVPESIGPFDSWANTQFALADTLTQHCIIHKNGDCHSCVNPSSLQRSFWVAFFGDYVREKAAHEIPKFSNLIGGALLGLDYMGVQDVVIGGGLAYAYNAVHYFDHSGHASINQESAVLYATWNKPHFYMNVALWGGLFQATHKRESFTIITSKAEPSGWNLSPHVECSTPFQIASRAEVVIDPFVALDWANNWQSHFREHGFSGFNIKLHDHYASILRTEAGLRFYETVRRAWGCLIFEEKLSYVNRTPLHKGHGSAAFIGAFSSFDVVTLSPSSQNLGGVQMHMEWIPSGLKKIYASFDYEGEFGSSFQSHMLTFAMGKNF